MSDVVYKIGVEMALAGTIAEGLALVGSHLTGIQGKVSQIEKSMGGWGKTLVTVGAILAGGAILKGLDSILDSTKELSHEIAQIEKLGVTGDQLAGARAAAVKTTQTVPGTTETSALEMFGQTYAMVGYDESIKLMPQLSRLAQVLGNTTGDYDSANKSVYQMIRSADLIGQLSDPITKEFDPVRLQHFLDVATKVAEATHGAIGPAQWLAMAQQGGLSLRGESDEGLIGQAIIGQAMGPGRSGTATLSMFQQFAGGTMFTRNAEAMEELGLLKPGEWHKSSGRVVLENSASKRLMDELKTDPLKFINETLIPTLQSRGITNIDDQVREIFRLFTRQTTQRMTGDELSNIKQMLRERERIEIALGTDQAQTAQNATDITAALNNMAASFVNLKTALGGHESENIVKVINGITTAVNWITTYARDMNIGRLLADLATFNLKDGLLTVVGGLQKLTGLHLTGIGDEINHIADALSHFASSIWSFFSGLGGDVLDKLKSLTSSAPDVKENAPATPAPKPQPVHTHITLDVDGKTLAQSVTDGQVDSHQMPLQAPAPNGWGDFQSPDFNYSP